MRPSKDEVFLRMAVELSRLSTCHRLNVGCVLIDSRGQVDGTGFNGVASGLPHCNESVEALGPEVPNPNPFRHEQGGPETVREIVRVFPHRCRNSDAPSGAPNGCESVHAEQNALMQCSDRFRLATAYVTHSPCVPCAKMLLNTRARRVVFLYEYPAPEARDLWTRSGRVWERLPLTFP